MQQKIDELDMRTSTLERDVKTLADSLKSLTESVQKLVITLDRGKWLGYGIMIMAGIQILGIKDAIKAVVGL